MRGSPSADLGITSPSPIYVKFFPKWKKCRDAVAGEDEIKLKGTTYLPKPSGMDDEDYKGYIGRAQFFNAVGRTLEGLSGMLNRKPVIVEVPKGMEDYLVNVDGKGHSFQEFTGMVLKDVLTTGWGALLVDMPQAENVVSQADYEKQGLSAYMVFYKAEACTKYRWQTNGRSNSLKYVILKEPTEVETVGTYNTEIKDYWRVLEIRDDGKYWQTLYNEKLEPQFEIDPKYKKGNFSEIPLSFISAQSDPEEPILNDLVNENLSYYKKSADYENGLHWTGVPTPFVRGFTPTTKVDETTGKEIPIDTMKLGGTQVLYFPIGTEEVGFLEFSGSGLSQIANAMKEDKDSMAILGARIIAHQKNGVEAAETAKIHNSAENSVLASFANMASKVLGKMLRIYLECCAGTEIAPEDVKVKINTDYDISTMTAQELTALVALWQSRGIAKSDLFMNLKEGEILSPDRDFDEMNAEIDEEQKSTIPPVTEDVNE